MSVYARTHVGYISDLKAWHWENGLGGGRIYSQEQGTVGGSGTPEIRLWGRGRLGTWGQNLPGICNKSIFRRLTWPTQAGSWERVGLWFCLAFVKSGAETGVEAAELFMTTLSLLFPSGWFCGSSQARGSVTWEKAT